jgi:hypothetical protein
MSDSAPFPPQPAGLDLSLLAEAGSDWVCVVDAEGRITWSSRAARDLTGHDRGAVIGLAWHDVLQLVGAAAPPAWAAPDAWAPVEVRWRLPGEAGTRAGTLRASPLAAGRRVVVLHDRTAQIGLRREARRLAELLDTAQEFGRLGVWERDIASGAGRWDEHVFRFWGLDPTDGTPSFDEAARRIHPDDRLDSTYRESTRQPGRYAARYRVIAPDGEVRRIHSQWEVKAALNGVPDRVVGIMVDDTEAFQLARSVDEALERLRLAAELTNVVVWTHDLRTDRIHHSTSSWHVDAGPPSAEGMPIAEFRALIHPDDIDTVIASVRQAIETDRPVDFEARYRAANGGWRHVLSRRVVQRDAAGRPIAFLGVSLDVTDRLAEQRRAGELAPRLALAVSAAGIGLWSRDFASDVGDWNSEMFRIYGLPPGAPVPSYDGFLGRIHPDDREVAARGSQRVLEQADTLVTTQFRIVRPDGSIRWIENRARLEDTDGRRVLHGAALDVTDRVEAELELRALSNRLQLTARGAGIGTWVVDRLSGAQHWDEQMFALRGLEPADAPPDFGARLALVHPEDRHLFEWPGDEAFWRPELRSLEFRIVWPDGSTRWLASRSSVVRDGAERIVMRVGVNWDITESKEAARVREERESALQASRAKSHFLARMSHELRTPLNAILGFAQLLALELPAASSPARKVDNILQAGDHLLSLINDVLDLSSIESGAGRLQIQDVPLQQVIDQALPLLQERARGAGVTLAIRPTRLAARADPLRLRQILLNLLGNAVKFNRAGGRVIVEARNEDGRVALCIHDDGPGIAPERLSQVGEPFNRLGAETTGVEGTGIGLSIVTALVEAMGGRLKLESGPGRGMLVEVQLPPAETAAERPGSPAEADAAAAADEPRSAAAAASRPARLLYIEDNPVNVLLVEEYLRSGTGYEFASAATGADGVARAWRDQPDLVLVDMQLPDFDGFEVLRRLRADERTRAIPCVALSANAMPEDIERALATGFDAYWTKPIDFRAFSASLRALLESGRRDGPDGRGAGSG